MSKKSPWRRFLLIWAFSLLMLGAVACLLLYRYLAAYEAGRSESVMEQLLSERSAADWLDAAAENLDFETSPYEDARALYERWRESLDLSGKMSVRPEQKDSDAERAVYVVRCGAVNLCRVELTPGQSSYGFGMHDWVLDRVSSGDITVGLDSLEVEITALAGQAVTLNGLPLEESSLTESGLPVEGLSALEARMDPAPSLVRYRVGPLYGAISVCDETGAELGGTQTGRLLRFNALPAQVQRVSVRAPSDLLVSVGGVTLTEADALSREAGILQGLEAYAEGAYDTLEYAFEGLLYPPEVTATESDGTPVEPLIAENGRYVFLHANEPETEEELYPVAETFFTTYNNYLARNNASSSYYELLNLTLRNSPLQKYFQESSDTMFWAIPAENEYRELIYGNFRRLGDKCFVCSIRYHVGVSGSTWVDEYSHEESNIYELVFVRAGRSWYAAAMSSVN